MSKGFDYSKWNHIELSDDEEVGARSASFNDTRVRPLTGPAPNGAGLNGLALAWR